jgi:hypothetical protein
MIKEDCQAYLDRWKLTQEVEEQELREAPFELLLQQTISIWEMGRTLGFPVESYQSNDLWSILQKKRKNHHV